MSMFCDCLVRETEDRFSERKLQHDLACAVGHFENGIHKAAFEAFAIQQFPDHGPRNFPGAIGVPQLFAFRIGDQLIADTRVEEVPRHESIHFGYGLGLGAETAHKFFIRHSSENVEPKSAHKSMRIVLKLLIPRRFNGSPHNLVNLVCDAT
jgi:hypothetical protein